MFNTPANFSSPPPSSLLRLVVLPPYPPSSSRLLLFGRYMFHILHGIISAFKVWNHEIFEISLERSGASRTKIGEKVDLLPAILK